MKKVIFYFVFILSLLLFTKVSYAEVYFYDDFSSGDLGKWDIDVGSSQNIWSVSNGMLKSSFTDFGPSTIYAKIGYTGPLQDYEVKADVMNISGIDQNFFVRISDDRKSFYQVGFRYNEPSWPQDNNNIVIYKFIDGNYELVASYPSVNFPRSFAITQNVKHKIKIVAQGNNIKAYFDGNLAIDFIDFYPPRNTSGIVGIQAWRGMCPVSVINTYDNMIVSSIGDTWQVPVETKKKIIIIPGLGASWNTRAMVYNDMVPDNSWQMTPFVNNYDGLVETLEKGGLKKNQDFYVWNYDWRRPVSEIVSKLNDFINQNVGADEKVDLVGHSLGGLTARIWAQNHSGDSRLDKVIAVGGPQRGAVDAYDVWNGAAIPEGDWVENIALQVLTELQRKNASTMVGVLRNYAPVFKDLIPTFDFVKKNGMVVKSTNLKSVNNYLLTNNSALGSLTDKIGAIVGTGVKTKEWVNLGKTNIFNQVLGYWPDGEPTGFDKGNGDGTVLLKSASLGQNDVQLLSKHGDLVTNGVGNILSELDLSGFTPVTANNVDLAGKLVFFIGSPAVLNISCDGGGTAVSDESGFALVDSVGNKICLVKVVGTDTGTYHLVTGKVGNEDSWRYYENEIIVGKSEVVIIDAGSGEAADGQNADYWYGLILRDINLLIGKYPKNTFLRLAKEAVLKKNSDLLMADVFNFRRGNKETTVTGRIINNLREILIGKYQKVDGRMANMAWKIVEGEKGFIDTLSIIYGKNGWKPSEYMSINYRKILDLEKNGQAALTNKKNGELYADLTLMSHLISHFW